LKSAGLKNSSDNILQAQRLVKYLSALTRYR